MKSEALRTRNMSQLDLEMDVTVGGGTTLIEIVPMELLFPR